jgi:DNA polymerase III alpha subunit
MYGVKEFLKFAKKHPNVKPIIGCEIYVSKYDHKIKDKDHRTYYHLILLAKNYAGYKNLMKIVSTGHIEGQYYGKPRVSHEVVEKYADNLILVKMPNPSIELVKTIVRENCLTKDIGYVFYDYIFIGPALLEQFRGFSLRNDEVLLMFTTALKDLAVELNVAMFTSTQVNASADDNKNIRNEASLAGGRSTINKADNGAIMARPTPEELESLEEITKTYGIPNCVTDIFKCRSGEWTQVRIWSQVDLGRLKKKDLFVTDARLEPIADFFTVGDEDYEIHEWDSATHKEAMDFLEQLNGPKAPEAGKKVSLGLSEYY